MAIRHVVAGPDGAMAFRDEVSGSPETTIQMGDSVQWTAPTDEHTIVSDNRAPFDSLNPPLNGDVDPDSPPYSQQFTRPGTFGYHCNIHGGDPVARSGMYGIIHVNAADKREHKVAMTQAAGGIVSVARPVTSNWFAWNDLQPPGPPSFHIVGDVQVPNPGVDLLLTERVPPGINPTIILLDLHFVQQPGIWPQMVVVKQARFDKVRAAYRQANVYLNNLLLVEVPVVDVG